MAESKPNKVLIFEPNPYHYEIIPGFADCFLSLGYEVDCLIHRDSGNYGDVFCRCPALREKIRIYEYDGEHAADRIEELKRENGYTLLFFSTIEMKNKVCREAVLRAKPMFENEQGIAGCSHTLRLPEAEYRARIEHFRNRIVTLTATAILDGEVAEVNPNFFCDTIPERALHAPPSVVSIGVNTNQNELLKAADRMYRKTGRLIRLVYVRKRENAWDALIHLIKLAVIAVVRLPMLDSSLHKPAVGIHRNVKDRVEVTGRIPFSELFDRIEAADFIALNFYEGFKTEFSTCRTSGSKQLSLGFLIPCIVEKRAAAYYGFTEKTAVIYEDGQLGDALERAASMSREAYANMVRELEKLRHEIRERSVWNLDRMLRNP